MKITKLNNKIKLLTLFTILTFAGFNSAIAQTNNNINNSNNSTTTKNEKTMHATAKSDVILIDVRTKEEYDSGHVSNAINIPYEEISKQIVKITTNKEAKIDVYCQTGRRSVIAKKTLQQMGYKNVQNLGSYSDLLKTEENFLP